MSPSTEALDAVVAGLFPGHAFMSAYQRGRDTGEDLLPQVVGRLEHEAGQVVSARDTAEVLGRLAYTKLLVIHGQGPRLSFVGGPDSLPVLECDLSGRRQPPALRRFRLTPTDLDRLRQMHAALSVLENLAPGQSYIREVCRRLGLSTDDAKYPLRHLRGAKVLVVSGGRNKARYRQAKPLTTAAYLEAKAAVKTDHATAYRARADATGVPTLDDMRAAINAEHAQQEAAIQRILFDATGRTGRSTRSTYDVLQEEGIQFSASYIKKRLKSLKDHGRYKGLTTGGYWVHDPDAPDEQ